LKAACRTPASECGSMRSLSMPRVAGICGPNASTSFHWHFFIGVGELYLGRVVHGIESLRKSVEINPHWGLSQFVLAAALALAGLLAEAAEVRAVAQRLVPNFTIARFRAGAASDNPVYLAQREHFYRGLRLACVPEG